MARFYSAWLLNKALFAASVIAGGAAGQDLDARFEDGSVFFAEPDFSAVRDVDPSFPLVASEKFEAVELLGSEPSGGELPWRTWYVVPHLETSALYDDNIFIAERSRERDVILRFSPGLALGYGDCVGWGQRRAFDSFTGPFLDLGMGSAWIADYTAGFLRFLDHPDQDGVDQDFRTEARWSFARLVLGAQVRAESKLETNADIGTRLRRKGFTVGVDGRYGLTEKVAWDVGAFSSLQDRADFVGSRETAVSTYLNWAYSPLTSFAPGMIFGRVDLDEGMDQRYLRNVLRVRYEWSEKTRLELIGGVEMRRIGSRGGDQTNPILQMLIDYQWSPKTALRIEAHQRVEVSALDSQTGFTLAGFSMGLRHQLTDRWGLVLGGLVDSADYLPLGGTPERTDLYTAVRGGVFYGLGTWGMIDLSYQWRRNDSNRGGSSFDNNQVELRWALTF
jgi:hypothetical protein